MSPVTTKAYLRGTLACAQALLDALDGRRDLTEDELSFIRDSLQATSADIQLDWRKARTVSICNSTAIYTRLTREESRS